MPYLSLSGQSIYHEVSGTGPPLLLLHGGFCSIESMRPQIEYFSEQFEVYAPERPGHGRSADRVGPMTYEQIVDDTLAYLDAMGLEDANILGFSDGAIAGLLLARDHGDRVGSLVAISANLDPGGLADSEPDERSGDATTDAQITELARIDAMLRADYDRLSPDGPDHGAIVLTKLARLWKSEPRIPSASLGAISIPTLIMAGDRDSIRLDHTVSIARGVPAAQLCIVPAAGHMVLIERPTIVNDIVREFLEPVASRAELRR